MRCTELSTQTDFSTHDAVDGTNTIDWLTCLVHLQSGLDYLSLNPVRSLSNPSNRFLFPLCSSLAILSATHRIIQIAVLNPLFRARAILPLLPRPGTSCRDKSRVLRAPM